MGQKAACCASKDSEQLIPAAEALSAEEQKGTEEEKKANPLKIGATMPDFQLNTTKGDFSMHSFLTSDPEKPWTVFFSHPNDFTPVCTTELGECHLLTPKFARQGCKLIGLSCNDTESHAAWSKDVLARHASCAGQDTLAFPIIADKDREIVTALGMLDPEEKTAAGIPLPARALVILLGTTVKLTILYPATTGRNFDEVLRVLISMQLTANNGLATPVDWKYNERVIVGPAVKTEDAQSKFEDFKLEELPSGKPYLRSVKCPATGCSPGSEKSMIMSVPPDAPPSAPDDQDLPSGMAVQSSSCKCTC